MTKYATLGKFLQNQKHNSVQMTFGEIEAVTGHQLPQSKRYPAWWSNNTSNNVMTKVWLDAGFRTEQVDIGGERLVFRRVAQIVPPRDSPEMGLADGSRDFRSAPRPTGSLFGAMKGTFTILPDLTAPAFDNVDEEGWDASIDRKADLIDAGLRSR